VVVATGSLDDPKEVASVVVAVAVVVVLVVEAAVDLFVRELFSATEAKIVDAPTVQVDLDGEDVV